MRGGGEGNHLVVVLEACRVSSCRVDDGEAYLEVNRNSQFQSIVILDPHMLHTH
jgi:hypothetical protein